MASQILLFDQPRAGAHLLQRMLSQQASLHLLYNNLGSARGTQVGWLMSDHWVEGMPEETRGTFERQIHDAVDKWQSDLAKAKHDGKTLMIQDHVFSAARPETVLEIINETLTDPSALKNKGNFTLIPDDLLLERGTIPILTIRDPRLAIPSTHRVLKEMGLPHGSGRPNFLISTSTLWQRMIYEFYVANGIEPLVVDADDVMTSPEFVRALAAKAGLEPEHVSLTWDSISDEARSAMHPSLYASQSFLLESSGVNPSRAGKNMDLEKEVAKWDEEFGEDVDLLREMLKLAEPSYQYLRERKFRG